MIADPASQQVPPAFVHSFHVIDALPGWPAMAAIRTGGNVVAR
jgi:hypothetical protein